MGCLVVLRLLHVLQPQRDTCVCNNEATDPETGQPYGVQDPGYESAYFEVGLVDYVNAYPNATIKAYGTISGERDMMREIYDHGPIACSADAEPMVEYTGGVLTKGAFDDVAHECAGEPGSSIDSEASLVPTGRPLEPTELPSALGSLSASDGKSSNGRSATRSCIDEIFLFA